MRELRRDAMGGGMRLRKGAHLSHFLALPRLEPVFAREYARDLHREYVEDRDVTWDFAENEKSSLYPVLCSLFRTEPLSEWELKESGIEVGALDLQKGRSERNSSEEGEVGLANRYSEKEQLERDVLSRLTETCCSCK